MYLLDLDDANNIPMFSKHSPIFYFSPRDHLRSIFLSNKSSSKSIKPKTLASKVRELLISSSLDTNSLLVEKGKVKILTMPRHLGFTFNPISIYFIEDESAKKLIGVIFEVSNTPWHDEILYIHPCNQEFGISFELYNKKEMHVSPFQPMDQNYKWIINYNKDNILIKIQVSSLSDFVAAPSSKKKNKTISDEHQQKRNVQEDVTTTTTTAPATKIKKKNDYYYFEAGFSARRSIKTVTFLQGIFLGLKLWPQRVLFGIHLQAIFLFLKNVPFYSHPKGTKTRMSRSIEFLFHSRYYFVLFLIAYTCWQQQTPLVFLFLGLVHFIILFRKQQRRNVDDFNLISDKDRKITAATRTGTGTTMTQPGREGIEQSSSISHSADTTDGNVSQQQQQQKGDDKDFISERATVVEENRKVVNLNGKRIAVVGSGIAGNGAAYELWKRGADVHIYESSNRIGGHAHTLEITECEGIKKNKFTVDVGFQVFNTVNYPLLTALFDELGVDHVQSDMSLSVNSIHGTWSSKSPFAGIFNKNENWFRILEKLFQRICLLIEILRFERLTRQFCENYYDANKNNEDDEEIKYITLGDWLKKHKFSSTLKSDFVLPLVGAIWSAQDEDSIENFAMLSIATFLRNHFMLQRKRPRWRTPKNRSIDYVNKVKNKIGLHRFHLNSPIQEIRLNRDDNSINVNGENFDHIVFACPAAAAADALRNISELRHVVQILDHFRTTSNKVYVHTDESVMPKELSAWAAWNAMPNGVVTYWLNLLQPGCCSCENNDIKEKSVSTEKNIFVTLNQKPINSQKILWESEMNHPLLDADAIQGRKKLIQGVANGKIFFAGAWTGYGFHEDGLRSAHNAVHALCRGYNDSHQEDEMNTFLRSSSSSPVVPSLSIPSQIFLRLIAYGMRRVITLKNSMHHSSLYDVPTNTTNLTEKEVPEICFELPDGTDQLIYSNKKGKYRLSVRINDNRAVYRLLLQDPSSALAEAYMENSIELYPSIRTFLFHAIELSKSNDADSPQAKTIGPKFLSVLSRMNDSIMHAYRANTKKGSVENIAAHYDLSNEFFESFLDETMTYSAALFSDVENNNKYLQELRGGNLTMINSETAYQNNIDTQSATAPCVPQSIIDARNANLKNAQLAKLDALLEKAQVKQGDHILEIGCGWGSLALRCCTKYDQCKYTAITISKEQLNEVKLRIAGLADPQITQRITIALCDYRDIVKLYGPGSFDKVLSCEMIEAVGDKFLPEYFQAIYSALKPGGIAALQIITVPDARYSSYLRGSDFIRKHIFPGSSLVCISAIKNALPDNGVGGSSSSKAKYRNRTNDINWDGTLRGLRLDEAATSSLGISYARTLAAWRVRFESNLEKIRRLGFKNDYFLRKWQYYLEYCEAGFASGHIDNLQIRLIKTDQDSAPETTYQSKIHGGANLTLKDQLICYTRNKATRLLDHGYLPDIIIRFGVRTLAKQQLNHCEYAGLLAHPNKEGGLAGAQEALRNTIAQLSISPVAVCTREANDQHYELDEKFYGYVLGPNRKYSACLFMDENLNKKLKHPQDIDKAAILLEDAEIASLKQVVQRAKIDENTRSILDLGCGWGSASLFLASRFPNAHVVGVSNSNSQREYILNQAKLRGITNLSIVTLDLSTSNLEPALVELRKLECSRISKSSSPGGESKKVENDGDNNVENLLFERAVSIEMFEHMKNYSALFEKIALVLSGTLFVHIFCHKQYAYHFIAKSDADWMARYFFAGGTMPSADLFLHFCARPSSKFYVVDHWRNCGSHYALTAEGWLQNMDKHKIPIMKLFEQVYPDPIVWWNRWRAFFIACAELFGFDGGNEWCVGHYLFQVRSECTT